MRYFVLFLLSASLLCFFSCIICVSFFVLSKFHLSEIPEDTKTNKGMIRIALNIVNLWVLIYTAVMSAMLLYFGLSTDNGIMKNVTKNE